MVTDEPVLWINGRLGPASDARLDPRDRGFTLGDGLFETMRVTGGVVPWLAIHLTRLRVGAAVIHLPLPWSDAELGEAVARTLQAAGLRDGVVRLTVSRGTPKRRGLLPDAEPTPTAVIHAQPFPGYPAALYGRGMTAIVSGIARNDRSPLARIKTLSALDNVLARREAAESGADEAILLNTVGGVVGASAANIFLVLGGALVTPDGASGVLAGVARRLAMNRLAPQLGLSAIERPIASTELRAADEAFLTSALLGVMPLVELDGVPVGDGKPGPITERLRAAMTRVWDDLERAGPERWGRSIAQLCPNDAVNGS
ncbi:MAG: aminotransferase class IV [Gemmatimonadaceae bacterium]